MAEAAYKSGIYVRSEQDQGTLSEGKVLLLTLKECFIIVQLSCIYLCESAHIIFIFFLIFWFSF